MYNIVFFEYLYSATFLLMSADDFLFFLLNYNSKKSTVSVVMFEIFLLKYNRNLVEMKTKKYRSSNVFGRQVVRTNHSCSLARAGSQFTSVHHLYLSLWILRVFLFHRYYSATILQMSGVRDDKLAIWLAGIATLTNFLFTLLGVWLVERVGRRKLTLGSIVGTPLRVNTIS